MASDGTSSHSQTRLFLLGKLANPDTVSALREALGLPDAQQTDEAALHSALTTGHSCIVIWADPAQVLAETIEDTPAVSPEDAVANWQAAVLSLLTLQRRHRRQMVLIPEAALASHDPETVSRLHDRLGLVTRLPILPDADAGVIELLARLALRAADNLKPLLDELEAASLYCPAKPFDLHQLGVVAGKLHADRAELDLHKAQLRLNLAATETLRNAAKQAQSDAKDAANRLAAETDRLTAELSKARSEVDTSRAARETEAKAHVATSRSLADAEKKASDLASEIAGMKAGLARAETIAQDAARSKATCEQECELLRVQIGLMQPALAEADKAQKELATLRAAVRQSDQAVAKARDEARQAAEARNRAEGDLKKARVETDKTLAEAAAKASGLAREIESVKKSLARAEALAKDAKAGKQSAEDARNLSREQVRLMQQALVEADSALKDLETLRAAATQSDHSVAMAREEAHQAAEARLRAEGDLARMREDLESLKRDADQAEVSRVQIARMTADLATLHERLIERENDLAVFRTWQQAVFASNSWKATAPLRRASQMLGRHRP